MQQPREELGFILVLLIPKPKLFVPSQVFSSNPQAQKQLIEYKEGVQICSKRYSRGLDPPAHPPSIHFPLACLLRTHLQQVLMCSYTR